MKKIAILSGIVGLAGVGYFSLRAQVPAHPGHEGAPVVTASPVASPVATPSASPQSAQAVRGGVEQRLKASFGSSIELFFAPDGRLGEVRGRLGPDAAKIAGFQPKDRTAASARGRGILESVQEVLGADAKFPLAEVHVQTGLISAQITYQQSLNGVPLEPGGRVVIDLGSHGELLGLSSEAWASVNLVNEMKLDSGAAGKIAVTSGPSTPVVWVSRPLGGGAPEGRYAYQFTVKGQMVVVDASNGAVLKRKDVRIH